MLLQNAEMIKDNLVLLNKTAWHCSSFYENDIIYF